MQKIVINAKHGGFGLSILAAERYAELSGFKLFHYVLSGRAGDFESRYYTSRTQFRGVYYWISIQYIPLLTKR